jgi:pimeloyl-ACP methyl ester carboxylesterase
MILRTETVEQIIDGATKVVLTKDIVMTSGQPLGMVRKRLPPSAESKGTVMLIHGFAQNRYTWHSSHRSFSAFLASEGWDVFSVDLRGHGRSRYYSDAHSRTIDEYIQEDVPACVREAQRLSGHSKVFLVGHSMGGMISYAAASSSLRDKVRGIVTIGSPYRFGLGNPFLAGLAKGLHALRFTGLFDNNPMLPLHLLGHGLSRVRVVAGSRAMPPAIRGWRPDNVEEPVLVEFLAKSFERTSLQILLDIITGADRVTLANPNGRTDYGVAFEALDRPLLVIAGTEDSLAPPGSVRRAITKSHASDKTYREFPFGHLDLVLGREATTTVWPLVRDWMARR